jgi:multidrug resistance protein MdtO
MVTATQSLPQKQTISEWFPTFLRDELTFYPGRAGKIARITIGCVLTFIVLETFRVPGQVYGVISVFLVSRDTPSDTIRSTIASMLATACGVALVLAGASIFVDSRSVHFFFLAGGFFLLFFLGRTLVNPMLAPNLVVGFYAASVIWDGASSPEAQVQGTLWTFLSITIGLVVACCVELVFVRQGPIEQLLKDIDNRLQATEDVFRNFSEERDEFTKRKASEKLATLAVVGTGRLRQEMQIITKNHSRSLTYYAEISAVIALTGRLVDVSASMDAIPTTPNDQDRQRLRRLAEECKRIRWSLVRSEHLEPVALGLTREYSAGVPELPVLERTVELLPLAFERKELPEEMGEAKIDEAPTRIKVFVNDAISNPDYIRFAVKGTLAAMICYIVYSAVDWPGISTAVLTCFLTGLSTIGATKQKQFNRLAGAFVGGALGIASLIFILPSIDSITEISLLVATGTAFSAWFATASPRISYFGLQTALGFYLTLLQQDYEVQISLVPPRDRLVGVLLAVVVMGFVFDHLWPTSAAAEMRREFAAALRNMGRFAELIGAENRDLVGRQIGSLRETINTGLANVHTDADSIKFEFGANREANLALRANILRWQAVARTLYLLELSLGRHLAQQTALHTLPPSLFAIRKAFCVAAGQALESLGDSIEGKRKAATAEVKERFAQLEKELANWFSTRSEQGLSTSVSGIVATARQFVTIVQELDLDIRSEASTVAD